MRTVYDQDGIVVQCYDVGAKTTIVTFASLGIPPGPVPQNEFHKILKGYALETTSFRPESVNIVTVSDMRRRWYIDGNFSKIAKLVNSITRGMGSRRTITLGTSMGGFAAVAIARRLRDCNLALAFGAHSSIDSSIAPFDTRSIDWRSQIRQWDIIDCLDEIVSVIDYRLVFGATDLIDLEHAKRYRACSESNGNVSVEYVEGSPHNVPMYWHKRGILRAKLPAYLDLALIDFEELRVVRAETVRFFDLATLKTYSKFASSMLRWKIRRACITSIKFLLSMPARLKVRLSSF